MSYDSVRTWTEGRVAHVQIDRPSAGNALDADTIRALGRNLARLEASGEAAVILLESSGDGAFCAGADLAAFKDLSRRDPLPGTSLFTELLRGMRHLSAVVIARVQGPAMGGGLGLVLASDLAVASQIARFGTPEVGVGLFPMMILAPLVRHLPPKVLARLVFSGEPLGAEEAERWGLVNEVVETDDLDDAIDDLIDKILRGNPTAIARGRRALYTMQDLAYEPAIEYLRSQLELLWSAGEAEEGVRAFLEKRTPAWREGAARP